MKNSIKSRKKEDFKNEEMMGYCEVSLIILWNEMQTILSKKNCDSRDSLGHYQNFAIDLIVF